jgi:hypothetical protein
VHQRWLISLLVVGSMAVLSAWVTATDQRGALPKGNYSPSTSRAWHLRGPDAAARREDALRRAAVRIASPERVVLPPITLGAADALAGPLPTCRFLPEPVTGTTAKFHCVFDGGDVVKVKYGRNPEIHAEAASTRLLAALGFASDFVAIVPRLRCYGCPRLPFETLLLSAWLPVKPGADDAGYTDFEWVAVERKLPAAAIETADAKGWAWWELKGSAAPPADVDALRLTAAFLAHWDNKAENQRLVCLDDGPPGADGRCRRPLAMIQDLGATFGPYKVNLTAWRDAPMWGDARQCILSMHALPYRGATFPDVQISEAGRRQVVRQLSMLTDDDLRRLFSDARFPQFYSGTDDRRDVDAWSRAFRARVDRLRTAGPCA